MSGVLARTTLPGDRRPGARLADRDRGGRGGHSQAVSEDAGRLGARPTAPLSLLGALQFAPQYGDGRIIGFAQF